MKSAKQQEQREERVLLNGSIKKSTVGKKFQKSSGSQRKNKSDVSEKCGISSEQGDYSSDKCSKAGIFSKMLSDVNQGEPKLPKIKLQLFPLDERTRSVLEKDGHNPFLELTLSARKKISSVLTHLSSKWGNSSIAIGELMLFPLNAVLEDLPNYKSWGVSDIGITAGDVHLAVGSPEIFRLRYGWISSRPNSPTSPLGCSHSGNVGSFAVEAAFGAENQANMTNRELGQCNMNCLMSEPITQTPLSKPLNPEVHMIQAVVNNEALQSSQTNKIENGTEVEKTSTAEPIRHEEAWNGGDFSQPSVLWSDLSNISIGGLLSEASLQGRFNTPGNSRSAFQPNTSMTESLDAFINQLNSFPSSATIDMPSSILNAEDTCHSFGFSKPSSVKDILSLGQSAFSGLSSHDTGSRPSRYPKSEANVQNVTNGCNAVQKANAETLPCSAGIYNNENSLGLSSIRWNDSLGPFDLPLIQQPIAKDDSINIGGAVR
ncbi:hypothetical protein RND81_11G228700 [Saponaria officinalis]|uniref:TSL-kinase interacting protein 1 n=1 Tax=Saponaria officinalis TaxID=3572 RepID=A0AAW1HQP4_SAPOF